MPVKLKSCGHKYHLQCIRDAMKYQYSMKCPECRNLILTITSPHDQLKYLRGDSPSGQMHVQIDMSSCAGYEDCGSIIITYNMETNPNSMQASRQRQKRVAFLPDNKEGNELLNRKVRASMVYYEFMCLISFGYLRLRLVFIEVDCLCKPHDALTYIQSLLFHHHNL